MDPWYGFLKMASSLVVVLGMMALASYGVKRYWGTRLGRSNAVIQVLATTYLDQKGKISLISVGKEHLLVGITTNQISLLTRLENPPELLDPIEKLRGPTT